MAKLTLTDLVSLTSETSALSAINLNNTAIEAALENTLSRDGSTPNTMSASLDMNTHRILNLPAASASTEPIRKAEFDAAGLGGGGAVVTTFIGLTDVPATYTGSSLQILRVNLAETALEFVSPAAVVSPAALTKVDDTNVTLALGGSPTVALLQATSLTLGWTGTLSVARGGTGASTAATAATALGLGTTDNPQFASVNIGDAADTTITRVSAGVIAVEGATLLTTATGQPLDADLTAIAALVTTAAGRSVLTVADNNLDQLLFWDDSAATAKTAVLADLTTEAAPAAGDFVIIYGAEGDVRKTNWNLLPGSGGGIASVSADPAPALGGNLNTNTFNIDFTNGTALRTGTSAGNTFLLQARDVDGAVYTTFATLTANNTPSMDLADSVTKASGYIYRAGGTDIPITDGGTGASTAAAAVTALGLDNTKIATITFVIDGGGSTITTGVKGDLEIPFACTITRATLLGDQTGSIVIDIWKDTYANYPPTIADTITASAKPTISATVKGQDATLTGWTTAIAAGDTLRFNVDSVTTLQRVTVSLRVTKT